MNQQQLTQLLNRFHHDAKAPLSAFRMYLELLGSQQEIATTEWQGALRESCDRFDELLQSLQLLTLENLAAPANVSLSEALAAVNRSLGSNYFQFTPHQETTILSQPKLLQRLFSSFAKSNRQQEFCQVKMVETPVSAGSYERLTLNLNLALPLSPEQSEACTNSLDYLVFEHLLKLHRATICPVTLINTPSVHPAPEMLSGFQIDFVR
jgi:signal transduction histidine kinase